MRSRRPTYRPKRERLKTTNDSRLGRASSAAWSSSDPLARLPAPGLPAVPAGRTAHPAVLGAWDAWGGGRDPGESYLEAAVREIREETGLVLDPAQVGPPAWRRDTTWRSRGRRRLQHEVVVRARVAADRPAIIDGGRTPQEVEDYVTFRWWQPPEITGSGHRFYPGRLPELLPAFLAGEHIDEPFERWN